MANGCVGNGALLFHYGMSEWMNGATRLMAVHFIIIVVQNYDPFSFVQTIWEKVIFNKIISWWCCCYCCASCTMFRFHYVKCAHTYAAVQKDNAFALSVIHHSVYFYINCGIWPRTTYVGVLITIITCRLEMHDLDPIIFKIKLWNCKYKVECGYGFIQMSEMICSIDVWRKHYDASDTNHGDTRPPERKKRK